MKQKLIDLRQEIDQLDIDLMKIISKRIEIIKKVGKIKNEKNQELLDVDRRNDVLKKWITNAKSANISEKVAEDLYKILHDYSIEIEYTNK